MSAGKTVFWDSRGIIFFDNLEKDQTITGIYVGALLDRLKVEIDKKIAPIWRKKALLHQDNARVPTCAVAMAKIVENKYKMLPLPPYPPDLAPCDYFLFPYLKKWLGGRRFTSNEEAIANTEGFFTCLLSKHFLDGLEKLPKRLEMFIHLKKD